MSSTTKDSYQMSTLVEVLRRVFVVQPHSPLYGTAKRRTDVEHDSDRVRFFGRRKGYRQSLMVCRIERLSGAERSTRWYQNLVRNQDLA